MDYVFHSHLHFFSVVNAVLDILDPVLGWGFAFSILILSFHFKY